MVSPKESVIGSEENSEPQEPKVLERFAERVSCQAIQEIVSKDSGWFRRAIWLLCFLGGVVLMAFQISERVRFYSSQPVRVSTYTVYARSVRFPAVTICNHNAISKTNMDIKTLERYFPLHDAVRNYTGLDQESFDWDAILNTSESFIKKCFWRGTKCGQENFTALYTDMGLCHSFNLEIGRNQLESDSSGRDFGLQLTLDANQGNYFRGFAGLGAGFKVMVHNPREPPLMNNLGFSVGVGMHTLVGLSMINISNLDISHWGHCNDNIKLKYFPVYSQNACRQECLLEYMRKACGCIGFLSLRNQRKTIQVPLCNPQQLSSCYKPAYKTFIQKKGQCRRICPVACLQTKYEVTLSQLPLADYYAHRLYNASGYQGSNDMQRNFVQLDLFFKDISYERREQYQAYNAFTLGCDIGGALGLILGASVLTIFEVGDFIILLILGGKGKKLC